MLLDTHVFLGAVAGSRLLEPAARAAIEAADAVYVSAASIREVAIKARPGKIMADPAHPAQLVDAIESSGFLALPVSPRHAAGVARLPDHHADPFDRLLNAQAIAEPLRLPSADRMLANYTDLVLRA